MPHDLHPAIITFAAEGLPLLLQLEERAIEINEQAPLPWSHREQLRAVQGHIERAEGALFEMLDRYESGRKILDPLYPDINFGPEDEPRI